MSNYSKVIIFIVILIIFSFSVISLYNSENSINQVMPDISDSIVTGDSDYNDAVDLVNDRNFSEARNKAISAGNNFNYTIDLLSDVKDNFTSDTNDVHKNYIESVLNEVELKTKAVNYLLTAIDYLEDNQNSTGTDYASQANDYIYESIEFQDVRNSLVEENPNLFK